VTTPGPEEGSAAQFPAEPPESQSSESHGPGPASAVPAWGSGLGYGAASEAGLESGPGSGPEAAPNVPASVLWAAEPDEGAVKLTAAGRARLAFRRWRRSRPFWGGLLITLGGGEILFSEKAPLGVVLHIGLQGLAGYLLPAVMVLCGLLLWFAPAQRSFYGILSVLLSLGTWLTSNLGGFILGMVLGLVGGSLAFGWAPRRPEPARQVAEPKAPDPAGTRPSTVS
jgi:Family of unknown function (DUF6114)